MSFQTREFLNQNPVVVLLAIGPSVDVLKSQTCNDSETSSTHLLRKSVDRFVRLFTHTARLTEGVEFAWTVSDEVKNYITHEISMRANVRQNPMPSRSEGSNPTGNSESESLFFTDLGVSELGINASESTPIRNERRKRKQVMLMLVMVRTETDGRRYWIPNYENLRKTDELGLVSALMDGVQLFFCMHGKLLC